MRFLPVTGLVLGLCLSTLPAAASSEAELQDIDDRFKSCVEEDSSNLAMKQCTAEALKEADKLLNIVYKRILGPLREPGNEETLARLQKAQRAWIPFRDAQCDLEAAQMLGGTGEGLARLSCLYTLTTERVKTLEGQFDLEL